MPEDAVRALAPPPATPSGGSRDRGTAVSPAGMDRAAAELLTEAVLATHPEGRALSRTSPATLLAAYGIGLWPTIDVQPADEAAVRAAEQLGYPVVLKSTSPIVRHQPGLAGVRVDLATRRPCATPTRLALEPPRPRSEPTASWCSAWRRPASPCVVRASEDPLFGPVVSFSVAGPPTDLLGDVAHRIPPLTDVDVTDLIASVKAAPLLARPPRRGAGRPRRAGRPHRPACSVLADDQPEVASLVLNPVIAWTRAGSTCSGPRSSCAPAPCARTPAAGR